MIISKQKKYLIISLICCISILTSCGKTNLKGRGDRIFTSVSTITPNPDLFDCPITLSNPEAINEWPASDFYAESPIRNMGFSSNYGVKKLIPLRPSKLGSKVRRTSWTQDVKYLLALENKKMYLHSPIFFDDKIVISDKKGFISAINIKEDTYKVEWEFPVYLATGNKLKGVDQISLSYGNKKVFVVLNNGNTFALDSETGDLIWSQKQNLTIRAPLKFRDGLLYGIASTGDFLVLDADDGNVLVRHSGTRVNKITKQQPSVLIGPSSAIACGSNGDIAAFDLEIGSIKWIHDLGKESLDGLLLMSDIDFIPASIEGMIIASSISGNMYLLREEDGYILWNQNITLASDIIAEKEFAFFIDIDSNLIAMEWKTGKIKWATKLPSETKTNLPKYLNDQGNFKITPVLKRGPLLANNKILIFTNLGRLMVVSPYTGEIEDEFIVPYEVTNPIIANNNIFVISYTENKLVVIN